MKKFDLSGKQDKLEDRKLRLTDGLYVPFEGSEVHLYDYDGYAGSATPTYKQDRLDVGLIRADHYGRIGYYRINRPDLLINGGSVLTILDVEVSDETVPRSY
ncbi:MAG: hypothetical protein HYX24_04420 [Candidatus Aenigmarchaeota archaeon]|nr:hypothetical protein [Candidatus Aenigmarchaeota archaeon]